MRKIEAIVRHESFPRIRDRLEAMGTPSMTVTEVRGSGRGLGSIGYRGAQGRLRTLPRLKLEVVVDEPDLEDTLDAILEEAHSGQPGDGKIFVLGVEEAVRVRTRERGPGVLDPRLPPLSPPAGSAP